jgi:hypothetical protein
VPANGQRPWRPRHPVRAGVAVAAIAGCLLAVAAPAAPAAFAGAPARGAAGTGYAGATTGQVIELIMHFPSPPPGLPSGPNPATFGLVHVAGNAALPVTGGPGSASGAASMGFGSLAAASGPLSRANESVAVSTNGGAHQAKKSLGSFPSNPLISGSLGDLTANVVSGPPGSASTARFGTLGLGVLSDILPAQVTNGVTSGYNQLTSKLLPLIAQLEKAIGRLPAHQVTDELRADLKLVARQLDCQTYPQTCLLEQVLGRPLLSFGSGDAAQSVRPTDGGALATGTVSLAHLQVLGGLLTVHGFTSKAVAFANGTPGQAHASGNALVLSAVVEHGAAKVTLGNAGNILGISLGNSPLYAALKPVLKQIDSGLRTLVKQLDAALAKIGVTVSPGDGSSSVSPDGDSAQASGASLKISVRPPSSGGSGTSNSPSLTVLLGASTAAVLTRTAPGPAPVVSGAAPAGTGPLAATGGNAPLTGGIAVAFLLAAFLIRRLQLRRR